MLVVELTLFFVVSDEVDDDSAYAFHGHTGKIS
jgi:hypothetical protein